MVEKKVWTEQEITRGIAQHMAWAGRALIALYGSQTQLEQDTQQTLERNGIGFNGVDAEILSSFAKQYQDRNFLSDKQLKIARKKLPKYRKQLVVLANK